MDSEPKSFESFRRSFYYGERADMQAKFLARMSDQQAADVVAELLARLGDALDTGDVEASPTGVVCRSGRCLPRG